MKKKIFILSALFSFLIIITVTLCISYGRENMNKNILDYKPYAFTQQKLSNGMEVLLIKEDSLPALSFDIMFKTGPDPKGKEGLIYLLAEIMDKGVQDLSAPEVTEQLELLGAGLYYDLGRDALSFSTGSLPHLYEDLLKIFSQVIKSPALSKEEFQRAKEKAIGYAQRSPENFSFYANRVFNKHLYKSHPYGFYTYGSLNSLKALKLKDIREFYHQEFHPKGAILTVAGRYPEDIIPQLEKVFGSWSKKTTPKKKVLAPAPSIKKLKFLVVDQPSAIQSEIRMGHIAVKRSHPDFLSLMVGNVILGRSTSSRLFTRLRERKGLTYHVYSIFSAKKDLGAFKTGMAVRNNKAGSALLEMIGVIEDFYKNGLTEEELKRAKNLLTNSFINEVSTVEKFADFLLYLASQDIPFTYVEEYFKNLSKLSLKEVNQAIKKHLHPDKLSILVLSNAEQIKSQLRDFEPITIKSYKDFL